MFNQMLALSGELLGKHDVKSDDEVSPLGKILGQWHSRSSHHFVVRRAVVLQNKSERKVSIDAEVAQT